MKYKDNIMREKIEKALAEINAELDVVSIGEFSLTLEEIVTWDKEESAWDRGKRDYDEVDVWDASNYKEFNEASLGQVYKHWADSKSSSFAVITSYHDTDADTIADSEKIKRENKQSFSKLKSDLSGYGYFNVLGHSEEIVDGKKQVLEEPSLFVINITLDKAMSLTRKYKQWGVIFCGPETDGHVKLYYASGRVEDKGKFHPGSLAKDYSLVRGKPFVFESTLSRPNSWIGRYAKNSHGVKNIPGIRKAVKYISKQVV